MSRTIKYKIIYFILMMSGLFIGILLSVKYSNSIITFLTVLFLLLAPGRLQGYLYREHFKGRKLMLNKQYTHALISFQNFLKNLEKNKWLSHAIWLGGVIYTKNIKAMTLNNIGACSLELGEFKESRSYLEEALLLDIKYALPYYNLAIIDELEGNHSLAIGNLNKSKEFGFSNSSIDHVLIKSQEILARIEGGKI